MYMKLISKRNAYFEKEKQNVCVIQEMSSYEIDYRDAYDGKVIGWIACLFSITL